MIKKHKNLISKKEGEKVVFVKYDKETLFVKGKSFVS